MNPEPLDCQPSVMTRFNYQPKTSSSLSVWFINLFLLFLPMNLEVEIKTGLKDYNSARKTISKIGKFIKKVRQIDTYYTPPDRDYYTEKPVRYYIRTRETKDKFTFEFHKPRLGKNVKSEAEEYEVTINDKKTFLQIIKFIGLRKRAAVGKVREYFMCGKFEIALDKVKDLGIFIEVEAKSSKLTKKDCMNFLKKSGVEFEILKNDNYALMAIEKVK